MSVCSAETRGRLREGGELGEVEVEVGEVGELILGGNAHVMWVVGCAVEGVMMVGEEARWCEVEVGVVWG